MAWIAGALVLLLLGCADASTVSEHGLPLETIRVGNQEITVEVAADPASRQRGLMHRESMPEDHGMLFIFPAVQPLSFWMKNTLLPLSIAYADADGVIVRIADMTPHSLEAVPSGRAALYALEMNQGWFRKRGVGLGDRLRKLPAIQAR